MHDGAKMGRWRYAAAALVLLVAFAAGGCNLQKFTADSTADLLKTGSVALDRESDLQFAREALPGSLKTIETFLVNSPQNEHLLLLLARGFFSYAFGFIEADLEAAQFHGTQEEVETLTRRAILHYLRAREYGFRLLNNPRLERAARELDEKALERELKSLGEEDVPGLFWTTYAWASAVNLSQTDPDMVAALPVIETMMNRVIALDRDFFDAGADVFFGVYYAGRPVMFGGKPDEAKKHFEAAMARFGDQNLLIPYLYGRFYAAQVQDRALFDAMMKKVLETDVADHPDRRLTNEVARARARFWLEHVDELFLE